MMNEWGRVSGGHSSRLRKYRGAQQTNPHAARGRGIGLAALMMLACWGTSLSAFAQAKPVGEVRATVLALDGEDLVIDIGAGQGATEGALVELWRPVKLRHPVSGKILEDRFRIGTLQLGQVRPTLSLARPSGELARTPEKGDLVILSPAASPGPTTPAPTGTTPGDGGSAPTGEAPAESKLDAEARTVAEMFDSLQGADLITRIRKYEEYVRTTPNGRYARVLYEEAAALRRLVEAKDTPKRRKTDAKDDDGIPALRSFEPPKEVLEGSRLELVAELTDDATGALLHIRRRGESAFETVNMIPIGPGYWSGLVPKDKLQPPEMEYFIEATSAKGVATPVFGGPGVPKVVDVVPVPKIGPPRKVGASATLLTDYADYNRLRGNDWSWQTEGIFGLRYDDVGVRALRTGFGVYRGQGGSLRDLDVLNLKGRAVGLTYGYLETEVGFHRLFSLIGRLAIGLQDNGVTGGGQVLFRIGSDRDTNLLLGGELLGGVGLRGFTQLELNTIKKVPILVRTEVTNQPAGNTKIDNVAEGESTGENEIGVRAIVQAGYRFTPDLVVSARVSFQGRTIDHAGPGFGGAVGYTW
ncbi:MAG: hypothetical protein IPM54_24825 [Polyangiaceae bacterium]|nr:hypothetical protein [Polyangiaceae bacterium]